MLQLIEVPVVHAVKFLKTSVRSAVLLLGVADADIKIDGDENSPPATPQDPRPARKITNM